MTRYKFHVGDVVRASGDPARKPVIGTVASISAGGGHHWYKVASWREIYNCREDELELLSRRGRRLAAASHLNWYRPEDVMPEDAVATGEIPVAKFLIVTIEDEPVRHPELTVASYIPGGEDVPAAFLSLIGAEDLRAWTMDDVLLWAYWIWPDYPDGEEEKEEADDEEVDPDV